MKRGYHDMKKSDSINASRKATIPDARFKKAAPVSSLYDNLPPPTQSQPVKKKVDEDELTFQEIDRTKVIFLDVDGVLRPAERGGSSTIFVDGEPVMSATPNQADFLPSALRAIRRLVAETGARIVISSEWRRYANLREAVFALLRNGCRLHANRVHADAIVPMFDESIRGDGHEEMLRNFAWRRVREIHSWLAKHPEVKSWVALDDVNLAISAEMKHTTASHRSMGARIPRHFVNTNPIAGFTEKDALKAIEILNRNDEPSPAASPQSPDP